MEALKTVTISKRAELAARGGHPWIYGSEIKDMDEGIAPGDMVKVLSSKGKFVGTGFYNPHSKITIRIFSTNANDRFDDAFWKRRCGFAQPIQRICYGTGSGYAGNIGRCPSILLQEGLQLFGLPDA